MRRLSVCLFLTAAVLCLKPIREAAAPETHPNFTVRDCDLHGSHMCLPTRKVYPRDLRLACHKDVG
jgi:hypothetical protein